MMVARGDTELKSRDATTYALLVSEGECLQGSSRLRQHYSILNS